MYINPDLYIFQGLTSDEVNYFALMCEPVEFNAGSIVLREGDESDGRAYFVEEGEAEVIQNGKVLTKLKAGDVFGEIALITNDPRSATIRAKSKLQVLALHRNEFLILAKKSGRFPEIQKEVFRRIRENFSK